MATKKTTEEAKKSTAAKKTTAVKKTTKESTAKEAAAAKKTVSSVKKTDTAKKDTPKKTTTVKNTTTAKKTPSKEKTVKKTTKESTVKDTTAVKKTTASIKKTDTAKDTTKKDTPVKTETEAKKTVAPLTSLKKDNTQKTIDNIFKKMASKDDGSESSEKQSKESSFTPLRTSSAIRKIEPIKTAERTNERESITLLKEAIRAKSKNVSKPIVAKKHLVVTDDKVEEENIQKNEYNNNNIKNTNENIFNKTSDIVNNVLNKKENEIILKENNDKPQTLEEVVKKYNFDSFDKYKEDTATKESIEIKEELEKIKNDIDDTEVKTENIEPTLKEETIEQVKVKEEAKEEKVTYTKGDIFKNRKITLPTIMQQNSNEESKFNQEEMDKAIENAAEIDDDTPVEDYQNYSNKKLKELEEKDIKIIQTEEELKTSTVIPEIEKKPVEPYKVPEHSIDKKDENKSNKLIPIIGIIIIILGLSFLGFQFLTSKNDNNDDGFYNIVTNENVLSNENINEMTNDYDDLSDISNINAISSNQNNLISNQNNNANKVTNNITTNNTPTNNIVTNNAITNQINKITNDNQLKTNNIQTNTTAVKTNTINTNINPPKEPELPKPPVIPDPPTPPATQNNNTPNNAVSYIGGNLYKTKWTDTLTSIATKELGDARKWPMIFAANDNIFTDPDKIVFNVNIKIPDDGKKKIEDMNQSEKKNLYDAYIKVADRYIELGKTNLANIVRNTANNIK